MTTLAGARTLSTQSLLRHLCYSQIQANVLRELVTALHNSNLEANKDSATVLRELLQSLYQCIVGVLALNDKNVTQKHLHVIQRGVDTEVLS